MIYNFTPSPIDNNLGKAYNDYMELIQDDDWAVFLDRDAFYIQENYIQKIHKAIEQHPDAGIITSYTNRVGEKKQCYKSVISNDPNIIAHKTIGDSLKNVYTYKEIQGTISGFLMIVKKEVWRKVGKFKDGLLGVDNDFSLKVQKHGYKIVLMEGLYVFHYYRLKEGISYKGHLT